MNRPPRLFYECECGCSAVAVDGNVWETLEGVPEIGVSLWRLEPNYYFTSWKQRLRYIRDILRYGHPHTDSVILDLKRARELGEHLIKLSGANDG